MQQVQVNQHVLRVLPPEPEETLVEVAAVLLAAPILAHVAHVEDDLQAGEAVLRPGSLQQLLQPRHLTEVIILRIRGWLLLDFKTMGHPACFLDLYLYL